MFGHLTRELEVAGAQSLWNEKQCGRESTTGEAAHVTCREKVVLGWEARREMMYSPPASAALGTTTASGPAVAGEKRHVSGALSQLK